MKKIIIVIIMMSTMLTACGKTDTKYETDNEVSSENF
jgi:major membrane immunogen (membrane-anchored lipoprotein)